MKLYDLCIEYEEKWQRVKHQYPPDPAMEETIKAKLDLMQMVRELEKITKREK